MNPYLIIGLIVAWISSLAGVGYWQRQDGITATEAAYAKRDNTELIKINAKLKTTEEEYRKREQQHAKKQAATSANYQEQLKNANQKTADLIARARAGTFRLHDPASLQTAGRNLSNSPASTGGCDGQTGSELSGTTAEFLLSLAGDANNIAHQLAACQSVVIADRAAE